LGDLLINAIDIKLRHFTTKTRRTRRFFFGFSSWTSCLRGL